MLVKSDDVSCYVIACQWQSKNVSVNSICKGQKEMYWGEKYHNKFYNKNFSSSTKFSLLSLSPSLFLSSSGISSFCRWQVQDLVLDQLTNNTKPLLTTENIYFLLLCSLLSLITRDLESKNGFALISYLILHKRK